MARRTTDRYDPPTCKTERKSRQRAKIHEIGEALIESGFSRVDEQSKVLNVHRSTVWVITQAKHKTSGLSASIIQRMLASPDLPRSVRKKILEYIDEKSAGLYGHNEAQLRRFKTKLTGYVILPAGEINSGRSRRQRKKSKTLKGRNSQRATRDKNDSRGVALLPRSQGPVKTSR
jgi:hypothetical protein